jgi:hypothetical protein
MSKEVTKMAWRLKIFFSDDTEELLDDSFESEEAALAEYDSWLENFRTGGEVLKLAGEDYCDADIEDYEIWEE